MSMYHLTRFSLREMAECGAVLRQLGDHAQSLEETAGRIVRYLYEHLGGAETDEKACVLVRLFKTHPFGGLDQDLQHYAKHLLGTRPATPSMPCFTLMATAGLLPEWNDRKQSQRFKAIPIADRQFVAQFPMFSQLMTQFGVELGTILGPRTDLLLDRHETSYNVFHVPDALGSPYVPCQEKFVVSHGVRSVLGFGGLLPTGSLFTVILFSKVPIPRDTAELFRTLALSVKIALLPFDGAADFTQETHDAVPSKGERAINVVNWLKARMAVQEQLLQAHDQAVIAQADRIEAATEEIREQAAALEAIEKGTAVATGEDFFRSLVFYLAGTLKVRYALIGELKEGDPSKVRTLAVWAGHSFLENFEYDLLDSPCAQVVGRQLRLFSQGVRQLFPDYRLLADLGVESYCGVPLFDKAEHALGLLAVLHDQPMRPSLDIEQILTIFSARAGTELERKRITAQLRETKDRLQAILDNTPAMIYVKDAQSRHIIVNRRFQSLVGLAEDQIIGKTNHELFPAPAADAFRANDLTVLNSLAPMQSEEVLEQSDGPHTYVSVKFPVFDGEGRPFGICGISTDITEHKQLEEQLLQAAKMEASGRLAGGIAHDFNNLLTAISGYSELLVQKLGHDSPLSDHAAEIVGAGERAAALTAQLLAFSRGQVVQPRVLDLNQVVANIAGLLRRLIGESIQLETRLAPKLFTIKADLGQLDQVLVNLAINARDAMPHGGRLAIETVNVRTESAAQPGHAQAMVRLVVSDTGHGMDEQTLAHIFEPFFTTKAPGQGTGLGLATVYGIVTKSGGTIKAESVLGQGSTFIIDFPAVGELVEPGPAPAAPGQSLGGTETILVVEDEASVRSLIRAVLQAQGYRVLEADSGEAALALCQGDRSPIDFLVTDVVMPGINGRKLAERLTALRPGVGVLYMSGYTEDEVLHQGVQSLGAAFLPKPFSAVELTGAVRALLDARFQQSGAPH
ncbi:MAG: response regulator [Nitrospirota bacterium]|nr:response regulator [Nitrospirota bacterium]